MDAGGLSSAVLKVGLRGPHPFPELESCKGAKLSLAARELLSAARLNLSAPERCREGFTKSWKLTETGGAAMLRGEPKMALAVLAAADGSRQ